MEKNADYTILRSVLFDNGRGFALGENPAAPSPFVTWQFTEEQGKRDYYWDHYHGDGVAAEKEFAARAADYQQRYGVQEVLHPIAEQMKEAGRGRRKSPWTKCGSTRPSTIAGSVRNGDEKAPPLHPSQCHGDARGAGADL